MARANRIEVEKVDSKKEYSLEDRYLSKPTQ